MTQAAESITNNTDTDRANTVAVNAIVEARPFLIDLRPAREAIAGLRARELLHAGPPLEDGEEPCSALRGAIAGTLFLEGAAPDVDAADAIVRSKTLQLRSGDEVNAACTFGGVITSTTPVFEVENRTAGVRGFAAINEGRGAALRYGSTAPETLQRVRWLNGEFAEVVGTAIRSTGGIDVFAIINQALAMGDELHSRQKASSALFLGAIAPAVCDVAGSSAQASRVLAFLASNDFFFLPVAMASAKSVMVAAQGIRHSSIVTAIAFNGAQCGIRVSGLAGWSTAPVPIVSGRYFKGFSERDAGPVIGDSEIMETMGLGAFAMAGAPALAQYVGGTAALGPRTTAEMYDITAAEHPLFNMPYLDARGTPLGIDARKVVALGIAPVFNTGIAHVDTGIGQIGAGYGRVPLRCFERASAELQRDFTRE